ncbi:MAG: radical SAM family heme chaperone HemW [Tannerellaceae bacterium]|jgi:oxygen-independent coproporphyrinogen-3 oxidase|nr:radical SAM family heme chaperone HemW [Tannerellaceae bacterium]
MAGLYIHVPFCVRRCSYCDFFSGTELKYKEMYLSSLARELVLRKDYLRGEPLETVYFGGGTPSLLQAHDFGKLFDVVYRCFPVSGNAEITLEANPDDMTPHYVASLRSLPFNRISMGVQSFNDADLRLLNRRHDGRQAIQAVERCKENGYTNISIDLMYGLPGQTVQAWDTTLAQALQLDLPHLSAYHLTYEEHTRLYAWRETGKVNAIGEELSLHLFSAMVERLTGAGYIHYEISNFAKPGCLSRHNSSYWTGKAYLGAGPSAHSYDIDSRQWNVSSLALYIKGMEDNAPAVEVEVLENHTRYNDYVITRLRTMWGMELSYVMQTFGQELYAYCLKQAAPHIRQGLLVLEGGGLSFSKEGILLSDGIMCDLLWT